MTLRIAYLPGDGVGPEVADAARRALETAARIVGVGTSFDERRFGGAAIDGDGAPFPDETRRACLEADAVLLGAVGGPTWDDAPVRPEAGLLDLRKTLGVFANLRPVVCAAGLEDLSPLKNDRARGVDLLIVRELTGGLYFGAREEGAARARDVCDYAVNEIERVARVAFDAARRRRGRVVSADKANVLATSRLWRRAVSAVHAADYEDVELSHELVDAMAMKLVVQPARYDVILTENLFGDILSDEAAAIAGSIGLAPSASLGPDRRGVYEPIHGSAPDIAGEDLANPIGAILSGAMLLRHSAGAPAAAEIVERAAALVLADGVRPRDMGGEAKCGDVADAVVAAIEAEARS